MGDERSSARRAPVPADWVDAAAIRSAAYRKLPAVPRPRHRGRPLGADGELGHDNDGDGGHDEAESPQEERPPARSARRIKRGDTSW